MRFRHVCLEAISYTLPSQVVTTEALEQQLGPLYHRLGLPAGRLELITGIRERRCWPAGTIPSDRSIETALKVIRDAKFNRRAIGALIHASVCRDRLEPATACRVHHALGLDSRCLVYDVSNACLGMLNGILQVAGLIELGHIRAGLVVGTEDSRSLLETTVDMLNRDTTLTRETIKRSIASLTIGSASAAVLVCHRNLSTTNNRLLNVAARAETDHHMLCCSGRDEAASDGMRPLMQTDSEALMREGIAAGVEAFREFLDELGWTRSAVEKTFCHQVGPTHRRQMLEAMGIRPSLDFSTVETLGNTGSVALPVTMAMGIEQGHLEAGDRVAMLGIGSGINTLMLGVQWQGTPQIVSHGRPAATEDAVI